MTGGPTAVRAAPAGDEALASWWPLPVFGIAAGASAAPGVGIWWGIGGVTVILAAGVVWRCRAALRTLFTPAKGAVLWGLSAGILQVAATYALYPLVVRVSPWAEGQVLHLYMLFRQLPAQYLAWVLFAVVAGEEVLWRGAALAEARRRCGAVPGAIVGAAVYALCHLPAGEPVLVLAAFACGAYWNAVRLASRSLLAPLACHLLWDYTLFLFRPLA